MIMFRAKFILLWVLLVMAAPLITHTPSGAAPRSVKVVMDNNYPPFVFQGSDGKLKGILIDQWRLWEQKTGIRVEIRAMDWGNALTAMKAGEFDVIDTIFKTPERSEWLDFTQPYAKLDVPVFFDKEISGITDASSLKGFVVAAKSGDAAVDLLKQNGIENIVLFNSYETVIRAAKELKITVFVVDKPPALYYLHKFGIDHEFRQSAPLTTGEFHRAVKKGNSELLKTIEDGFAKITPKEQSNIETFWYGSTLLNERAVHNALIATGVLVVLLCALFVWNRILRKLVKTRMTELETSEDALRASEVFVKTLVNSIPAPIFYKDIEGRYMGFNSSFEEFYGTSQEKLIGKSVFDVAPPELAETYHAKDLELFRHAGTQVYESQVKNARGALRDVIFHKAAFYDAHGTVSGLIGVILDITELRKAEADRMNLERQLFHAQKLESLGVMSGGIAHDFNNQLQAVLGNLDLALRRLPGDVAGRTNIDRAVHAAQHAAKLTAMMLAYSGNAMLEVKEMDLTELVEEHAGRLAAAISGQIFFEQRLGHGLPPVMADAGQIRQVVMNLVSNASEAIGDDKGVITITTGAGEFDQDTLNRNRLEVKVTAGTYVWLEVSDSGCGMDEETKRRLFDPFFTTKSTGRGLGMSEVLGIVRAHKGALLVESRPGAGSVIRMLLPPAKHHRDESATPSASFGIQPPFESSPE